MKKHLLVAVLLTLGVSVARAGHFIDVLPPASAAGCMPVSNGYDYQCTNDTAAPTGVFNGITASTVTATGGIRPGIATKAVLATLTSTTTGQLMICSDCTRSYLCVSSGTVAPDSYVVAVETATIIGGPKTKCQ